MTLGVRAAGACALSLIALIAASPAHALTDPTACGEVTGLEGQVELSGNAGEEAAGRGSPLAAGDRVATSRSGLAELRLDRGALIRLAPNTRVRLSGAGCDPAVGDDEVAIVLDAGSIHTALDSGRGPIVRAGRARISGDAGDAWTTTVRPGGVEVVSVAGDGVEVGAEGVDPVVVDPGSLTMLAEGEGPTEPAAAPEVDEPFWETELEGPDAGTPGTGEAADEDSGGFGFGDIERLALTWLPIVFFAILVLLIGLTLRVMPRTKPQKIRPQSSSSVSWDQIAGVDETKDELREVVEFLSNPDRFRRLGARVPKGILLHGPPGTGKTLLAKAVAHESGATFFSQSAASFIEMFAGLGAARIRRLFKIARENAPAIVFIDELDAVGGERGSDISGERDQTLNQLLVELDGFESRDDVVVMAASNLLEKLDKALLRPGRFDRQVLVPPPDREGRLEILRVHTRSKPLAQDVDLESIAAHTAGLTGADLANLCNEAAIFAGRGRREFIAQADLDSAFERVVAGLESRRAITEDEKRVIAWHEAGHALVREALPSVDRVHKVSIVPRGQALGFTLNTPEEDRHLRSREDLVNHMAVLLGGRVAEQLTFGRITTGAADDLRRVTEIARSMVEQFGMGTQITAIQAPRDDWMVSESLKSVRDHEVRELADSAYRLAARIIGENREILDRLAETLLEREVLDRADLDRVAAPLISRRNGEGAAKGGRPSPRTRQGTPGAAQ